jgi:5-formyltetrahydrofolate cyclo-ligase
MADTAVTTSNLETINISPDDQKADIRTKVWNYLAKNRLVNFPYPPHRRISNFKGADVAGDLVSTLDVFKAAKCLKVDPDKPLQQVRFRTLQAGKTLLVPTPRLRSGLFNRITPPADADDDILKTCTTRQGTSEFSVAIGLDDSVTIDLIVVGCVAVSPKGWRIGKGAGFSDMEYAMMVSMGAVNNSVPVVTIVHDCQVLDLPDTIFQSHDLPVDYIVTPTRVIRCEGASTRRPAGMIWSLLSADRVASIPVLGCLRYREWKAQKDVQLSGELEAPVDVVDVTLPVGDVSDDEPRHRMSRRKLPKNRLQSGEELNGVTEHSGKVRGAPRSGRGGRQTTRQFGRRSIENGGARGVQKVSDSDRDGERAERSDGEVPRGGRGRGNGRRFRRGTGPRVGGDSVGEGMLENGDEKEIKAKRTRGIRHESDGGEDSKRHVRAGAGGYRRHRFIDECEGSVYIGSVPRSVRVSEFKAEVRDRDVQPLRVVWRGGSGFAFLNFRTIEDAEQALAALEGLHISDHSLRVEMAKSNNNSSQRRRRVASASRSDGAGDEVGHSE